MIVEVHETAIADVLILKPGIHADERGFLSEVFNEASLARAGIQTRFVQENHTLSIGAGTVRGLHFQIPPQPAAKLVRCTRGSALDVAVDLRRGSETYGMHVGQTLSEANWLQMFIPEGFAHGFCTLEPNTEVVYKASAFWDPNLDRGVRWDDPDLAVEWPVTSDDVILSDKDREQPAFRDIQPVF